MHQANNQQFSSDHEWWCMTIFKDTDYQSELWRQILLRKKDRREREIFHTNNLITYFRESGMRIKNTQIL